jgi:hypothetical protein
MLSVARDCIPSSFWSPAAENQSPATENIKNSSSPYTIAE